MPFEEKDILYVHTTDGDYPEDQTENVTFAWGIEKFGFGTTTFWYDDGKLKCDNEALSKEQIKMILCKFVDQAEFTE